VLVCHLQYYASFCGSVISLQVCLQTVDQLAVLTHFTELCGQESSAEGIIQWLQSIEHFRSHADMYVVPQQIALLLSFPAQQVPQLHLNPL
jgi:hypothetical protein